MMNETINPEHDCQMSTKKGGYGVAVEYCYEDDGYFWVSNGEYASQVNYCPICGKQAPNPAEAAS